MTLGCGNINVESVAMIKGGHIGEEDFNNVDDIFRDLQMRTIIICYTEAIAT